MTKIWEFCSVFIRRWRWQHLSLEKDWHSLRLGMLKILIIINKFFLLKFTLFATIKVCLDLIFLLPCKSFTIFHEWAERWGLLNNWTTRITALLIHWNRHEPCRKILYKHLRTLSFCDFIMHKGDLSSFFPLNAKNYVVFTAIRRLCILMSIQNHEFFLHLYFFFQKIRFIWNP